MSKSNSLILALCGLALAVSPLPGQDTKAKKFEVLKGPATAKLGDVAQIELPDGYSFVDGKTTRTLLKSWGEPTSGRELGLLKPASTNDHWSVYFEYDETGYVKDDDKNKLDADKLLQSIVKGNDAANKERERAGNPPLIIVGWEQPPKYDETTHNLEWAIRATSEGRPVLNYNTRLLGRKGVMEVVLVVGPEELPATLPEFKKLLADYKYQSGQTYAEYKPGDKVAKYGLAALVVGGAAVGAAKLGLLGPLILLFKKAWKLVVIAVVAVVASFTKILGRLFGGRRDSGMPQ